ncbi:RNA polymerase sigma-70 factor [Paenibacillus methanolicus]|uniref:RNA polymerase sigma-70 factor (ECF subfamily) n=1 Tax=Paenibacillus methanolicus TaxID=582686 RepID=A0A5S5BU80_9BACL|nr:RNA polymerase sigma-70 factor [Paenibacillus methanolicus]TYP70524.1 RNA polymerase sigma-70 factor (ECF subfamily) [Paenibacillus methanolicus]
METEQLYREHRSMLIGLAYRMLGSAADAEDIVQDTFIAFAQVSEENVRSAKSYLCKMVANRCIDKLRGSASKRETYIGPWLPEPVITDDGGSLEGDPLSRYVHKESLSTAYLLLLQQLTWTERAVFLLREVLDFEYDEIAEVVGKSSVNCRQIFRRAKRGIGEAPLATPSLQGKTMELVQRFAEAMQSGSVPKLLEVLAADAVMRNDGGGKILAATKPILGADRIIRFFMGIQAKSEGAYSFAFTEVNGLSGIVTLKNGRPHGVMSFEVRDDQIVNLFYVVNPEKLTLLQADRIRPIA